MKTFYNDTLQITSQYQIKFYTIAYGLILLMTAAAFHFKDKEIILPELAALSIGCFIYKKNTWTAKPLHLFLLPSITAFIGFFINQLEINMAAKIVVIMIVMLAVLYSIKSNLAPALATGLLPIVTNCNSYIFLISIVLAMGLLAILTAVFFKPEVSGAAVVEEPKSILAILVFLAVLIVWVIICSVLGTMQIAALPPVIVMGYELIDKKMYSFTMLYKQVAALMLAAFIGAQSFYFLDNFLLAAFVNLIAVTIMLHYLKMKMPPVYAMAMLPMVLPSYSHVYFALSTGITAAVLLGTVYLLINKTSVKLSR
ncbi:hypothetical protein D0809_16150 [Flavobacterium circumlabens]|uniref:HPP family protein n=1 Tax=Flavobacterium circumlabens TaxID=2133765 RepID=A0A4Y7UB16_9FLAO|nr:hypothetical protein [Flavobacterium circumlabens]TCN55628.1 hypothetical protein EV142_106320 [Flavobacterium circumlabens]TEB42972.1 hypothetical protein D0809_16150 [Flavobacterium circumlabens]